MDGTDWPLIGVVLAGGKSQRMGVDKASLRYHDRPQAQWTSTLLIPFTSEIVVVFKEAPADFPLPFLTDDPRFGDTGPISGLLTAIGRFPDNPLLVVGCDYPLLDSETILTLLNSRSRKHLCTAFRNPSDGKPEPLLAVYEPSSFASLSGYHELGNHSLRRFLESVSTHLVDAPDVFKIESYDKPEQAERLLKKKPEA